MAHAEFNVLMEDKVKQINLMIESFLPEEKGYQKSVFEAVNYSIKVGGKRIRPLFMLETYLIFSSGDTYKDETSQMLPHFIAAIEMIHTYSLVHDDLPAVDNDLYRRGQLTTHAKYGEALGILAGDGLLNLAYETAAAAFYVIKDSMNPIVFKRLLAALNILSKKAGIFGMVGGQTVDIEKSGNASDIDELTFIYKLKTAALLESSFLIGAVLAGAEEATLKQLEFVAENIGLAFQIQDDILDVTGDEGVLGKPIHSDEKNKKATYVTLYSLLEAEEKSERLSKSAIEEINLLTKQYDCEKEKEFLNDLIVSLIQRKK